MLRAGLQRLGRSLGSPAPCAAAGWVLPGIDPWSGASAYGCHSSRGWSSKAGLPGGDAVASSVELPAREVLDSAQPEATTSSTVLVETSSTDLEAGELGTYYPFRSELVPEAFKPFHQTFYAAVKGRERSGGCKGLQEEFKFTRGHHVMYRRCLHELIQGVSTGSTPRLLLEGPTGAGKSVALAALVEWGRAQGWLVMYIPSASTLTSGGYFVQRPGTQLWDTLISAQQVLKSMLDAHGEELQKLPRRLAGASSSGSTSSSSSGSDDRSSTSSSSGGGSLRDLVIQGLATEHDAQLAVESCLALRDEMLAVAKERPVLFAVDDYNSLYWDTGYGSHKEYAKGKSHRVPLAVEQLPLASSMRLLEQPLPKSSQARVVCAVTWGRDVSPRVQVPLGPRCFRFHVPRFSEIELAHSLQRYYEAGLLPATPSQREVSHLLALTLGNAKEVRRLAVRTSLLSMPNLVI